MAKVHDKFVIELAEVIKGYGNDPDVDDPFRLSEFYRFYELPEIAVSANHFKTMIPLEVVEKNAQPGWTYIEEELPETIINKHTHNFQEYNCLCDFGDNGFDVRTYKFGNGHFWNGGGIVDKYVTAWQPLPETPDALK